MSSIDLPKSLRPKQQTQQQTELPKTLRPKEQQKQENISFESDEDLDREIERNQAQITSRMLERLFGTFGNAYQMTPEPLKKINPLNFLYERLPTEKQLREFSEKASGGYTKPKTTFEEKVGETAADVASYAMGGSGKTLLGTSARILGIPIAGQMAKEGIELAGGGEKAQQYGKIGTMFLLDLWGLRRGIGGGGAKKFGEKSLQEAETAIPKNAKADVTVFEQKLNSLDQDLRSGITGPHTSEALRAIDEIKGHISNGQMDAWRFPQIRRDINKLIENMKGFSIEGPPKAIRRAAVDNLNKVKVSLIQAGNRWGRGNSPEFFNKWREGNEALAVYHRSNDVARFVSKATKIKNPVLKVLMGVHGYHHPGKTLGLQAVKKGVELTTRFPTAMVYRFMNSKVLRDLYTKVLQEASKGNSGAVASGIAKLEKEMDKEKIK
jgi:hypothetical protein